MVVVAGRLLSALAKGINRGVLFRSGEAASRVIGFPLGGRLPLGWRGTEAVLNLFWFCCVSCINSYHIKL